MIIIIRVHNLTNFAIHDGFPTTMSTTIFSQTAKTHFNLKKKIRDISFIALLVLHHVV